MADTETIQAFSDIETEVELYPPVLTPAGYDYPNKIKTPFWDTEEESEDDEDGDT